MFDRGALTLFRIRGVPIRAHWTLLLVLPYLALMLSVQFGVLAGVADVAGSALILPPLVWGLVLAVGLFASVALHELAHTVVALRAGGKVRSITLMLLGGVSQISRLPPRRGSEAVMALAGPLASAAIGGLLLGLRALAALPADVEMGLFYLGATNLALALFNLVPAFPMDGGRILRALLATRLGVARATAAAARVGKIFAIGMGGLGLVTGNLLLILVAVFVYVGAASEAAAEQARALLSGVPIGELVPSVRGAIATIPSSFSTREALTRMRQIGVGALVVTDPSGAPTGVVRVEDVATVAPEAQPSTPVAAVVAARAPRHVEVAANLPAEEALDRAAETDARYLIVVRPGAAAPARLVGLVSAAEIGTALSLRLAERGVEQRPASVTAT
jgi:Zn-dependent protease/CBS domain-containing protein